MKVYERVSVEVVKFEAQDVITASVAAPVCTCPTADEMQKEAYENNTDYYQCEKTGHPGCEADEHHCPKFIA